LVTGFLAVIEDLDFLKKNVEPWEEVETKWRNTFDARRRLIDVDQTRRPAKLSNSDLKSAIRAEKAEKIAAYFEDFKPLQQPCGFMLVSELRHK